MFPVHCVVYICAQYLCRQGLALHLLSVISDIGHSEVDLFCDICVQSDTSDD